MVYGTSLTLPADLLVPSTENVMHNAADYSHQLKAYMQEQRPIQTAHNVGANQYNYVDSSLLTCEKVLVRNENRRGLQANYKGPFKVVERSAKYFTIELANGTPDNVSIDRLKACYNYEQALPKPLAPAQLVNAGAAPLSGSSYRTPSNDVRLDSTADTSGTKVLDRLITTRSGRVIRTPARFKQ